MPVKNAGIFLFDTLLSIQNQTEKNWELIAVDDNSTDNSFLEIEKFSGNEHRIKLLKNKGNGIIDALQTGFNVADGEFITRMDADDLMAENKLELLKNTLKRNGTGNLATAKVKYFSENGVGDGYKNYEEWLNNLCDQNAHWNEIYKECVIPSPCWMMHKVDFEECGTFNSNVYPEDYDLTFRFYKNGINVCSVNEVLHFWRDHKNRTSRTNENYADNRFLELKLKYFLELDFNENKQLVLWGAGKKGKWIARKFIKQSIDFQWITNNRNKVGKDIFGVKISSENEIEWKESHQIIIAIANKNEQEKIKSKLKTEQSESFFFC